MDPFSDPSSATPSFLDDPFSAAAQAQQLLQSAGWTYYTIWRKNTPQNPLVSNIAPGYSTNIAPGLVWSQGDVNRSLLMPDQNHAYAASSELITSTREHSQQISKACKMGYLLQQFYKYCSFLPLGLGVAGMAMTSGRYQWANTREEIFEQMGTLSTYNRQHLPRDLQEDFFETMVCIPLPNGAGVLEMGTNALVPESEGMLLQMLGWTKGLATGRIHREREQERFLNPALNSISVFASARDISSMSSSYCSSSSAVSSPPSADHQRGSTGALGFRTPSPIPSMSDEDIMLAASTPAPTSLPAPKSINQLADILNQLGNIELQYAGRDTPSFEPAFANHERLNPSIAHNQPGAASPLYNTSGGLTVASMRSDKPFYNQGDQLLVGSSTEILSKPAASGLSFNWYSAGSVAKGDDQYTTRNMQQGEAKGHNRNDLQLGALKDHYIFNMQLKSARGCFINKQERAAETYDFINMHQEHTAGSGDDRHIKMGRHAGMGSAAAEVSRSRHGAFKSWRRSLRAATRRKKQTETARSDSFLKKLLVHYLPSQQIRKAGVLIEHGIKTGPPESLIGYMQDLRRASSLQQLILQGKEAAQVAADDHEKSPSQPDLAAINHKIAERNRRQNHAECYKALRNLVPAIAKKDKVALLEQSIVYLNELNDRVLELHREKDALVLIENEDNKDARNRSSIQTNSQAIASCLCLPCSMFKDGNYFYMKVEKLSINHEDINTANIDIISAIQKKNLHCIKFKLKSERSTQKVDIEILAKYKDGDNCSLSLDGIQAIENWWPTFARSFEIDKL